MRIERILTWAGVSLALLLLSCGGDDGGVIIPEVPPPRAPSDLQIFETSNSAITLVWRDLSEDETGFRIERSVGGAGSFADRDTVPRDITIYADTQVEAGQTYYYRTRAYLRGNASEPSDAVWGIALNNASPSAPSAPNPPDLARGIEQGTVSLSWSATDGNAGDLLTYDLFFGQQRNDLSLIAEGITATTAAVPELVELNSAYFWQVVVRDPKGAMRIGPVWGFNTRVERVEIPAGWLVMGEEDLEPHPGNPVWVDAFEVDRFEVTNQQFAVWLNEALRSDPPLIRTSGGEVFDPGGQELYAQTHSRDDDSQITYERADSIFLVVPGRENYPVIEVTYEGARTFAEYYDRRLPTEAEWEMAAKGNGTEYGSRSFTITEPDTSYTVTVGLGRIFPWGQIAEGAYANFANSGDPFEGQSRVPTTPVGFFDGEGGGGFETEDGSSVFGVHDLAGNVAEWCQDWFAPYTAPHNLPDTGTLRIIRGGSWSKGAGSIQNWRRDFARPYIPSRDDSGADRTIGFRTAVSTP